jgi:broad specificity phosphatase PhoE
MLRHGKTRLNIQNAFRGWSNGPDADLNAAGIQSAIDASFFLAKMKTPIRRVICSDLNRTVTTAEIACTILGIDDFEVDKRLRPLHVGDFAGKDKSKNPIEPFLADKNLKFPNGENVNEFEARQHEVSLEIISRIHKDKINSSELLVIAHVSNIMYWYNVQSGKAESDEYLHETTDIVDPGGIVIVSDRSVVPIFKWSEVAMNSENIMDSDKKMAVS